jgi:hypothetical protein
MATSKKDKADAGQAEVEKNLTDEQDKGYFGLKADPRPNSEHSLESGPDAPPIHEQPRQVDVASLEA